MASRNHFDEQLGIVMQVCAQLSRSSRRRLNEPRRSKRNPRNLGARVVFGLENALREYMTDNLLDIPCLAKRLGVGERHIRRLIFERRIPFIKWGHLIRFDPADIDRWLEEARQPAVAPGSYPGATSPVRSDRARRNRTRGGTAMTARKSSSDWRRR